ncbi:MAG: methyltransferase domain-containing protein [Fibrobacteria bacterium]
MSFHSLRFDRAAATYDQHARVQERMADMLLEPLPGGGDSPISSILEMGCGTGILSRRLRGRFPSATLTATDAAPRMLAAARQNLGDPPAIAWSLFDASGAIPAPEAIRTAPRFGLAASNALVQWFPDLRPHFSMVAGLLVPSAAYLVSGFSRDNFPELNAILREPPFSYPEYPGHAEGEVRAAAAAAGFTVADYREEAMVAVLPSPAAFLESIRGLGSARRPETGKPLTRSRLRLLLQGYQERYGCAGGVLATWKPWLARLQKA